MKFLPNLENRSICHTFNESMYFRVSFQEIQVSISFIALRDRIHIQKLLVSSMNELSQLYKLNGMSHP